MLRKIFAFLSIARVQKPVGTTLLFLPCLWGVFLGAQKVKDFLWLFLFYAGAFLMRSAGCILNDFFDKDFDKHIARTKNRPLVTKELTSFEALSFFAVLCLLALVVFVNLSPVAQIFSLYGFFIMLFYPLLKRVTYFPQVGLGLAFNCGVFVAYACLKPNLTFLMVLKDMLPFYIGGVFWTLSYDTLYAFQDFEEDKKIGVKSLTYYFSSYDEKRVLDWLFLVSFIGYLSGGKLLHLSHFYELGLCLVIACHFFLRAKLNMQDASTYKAYFSNQQWIGILVGVALLLGKLL